MSAEGLAISEAYESDRSQAAVCNIEIDTRQCYLESIELFPISSFRSSPPSSFGKLYVRLYSACDRKAGQSGTPLVSGAREICSGTVVVLLWLAVTVSQIRGQPRPRTQSIVRLQQYDEVYALCAKLAAPTQDSQDVGSAWKLAFWQADGHDSSQPRMI